MSKGRLWTFALLFVAGHLLLTLAYSMLNPLGEAPDEADHWAVVVHLAREKELPVGPRITQSKHPPFYHIGAALAASLGEADNTFMRANPDVELTPRPGWSPNFFIHTAFEAWPWNRRIQAYHLARFWSVLLNTATVLGVFLVGMKAFPNRPWTILAATGLAAFLPEFAFIGAAVNNDNAAALFGTLAILGGLKLYRADARFSAAWWTPIALGLGLLSKVSTLAVWPMVAIAILWGAAAAVRLDDKTGETSWPHALFASWRRWIGSGLLVFVPAVAIASPWLMRNQRLYGDPFGMSMARQTIDLREGPWAWADTFWLLKGWFVSFWGKFGGAGHIPMADWIYWTLALLGAISVLGLGRLWVGSHRHEERPILVLLAAAVAAIALIMWRYSLLALGTDQGRLLYPAIAALIVLFAAGLLALAPARQRGLTAWALIGASLLLGLYALFGVIMPAFASPEPVPANRVAEMRSETSVDFGDLILIHWSLDQEPTLIWLAEGEPNQDWRTVLRITSDAGDQIWERRRSPGAGRWATDTWPAGTAVADAYRIDWPDWAPPGIYRVEVALQAYGKDPIIAEGSESPFVLLGHIERR